MWGEAVCNIFSLKGPVSALPPTFWVTLGKSLVLYGPIFLSVEWIGPGGLQAPSGSEALCIGGKHNLLCLEGRV